MPVRFCADHWERLKDAVRQAGLWSLVAENGEQGARNIQSQLSEGLTVDNFDPLIMAHNAIFGYALEMTQAQYDQNPQMFMADSAEHPEWACPICALNWCHDEHIRLCLKDDCDYPNQFDWAPQMIDRAVELVLAEWRQLGAGGE